MTCVRGIGGTENRLRAGGQHKEYGPRALSDGQRALGLPAWRRPDLRNLVKVRQITREDQDRWAERSQKRFAAAQAAGKFAEEIAPVELCERNKPGIFNKDEHNRPDTTLEMRHAHVQTPQANADHDDDEIGRTGARS